MRNYSNWINAFVEYASFCEAPDIMYKWTAVSTIAGALKRRVWIDNHFYKWYPNEYIVFVAPPEVVSKTTTASIGMKLLRRVPGIDMGPNVMTWQALVKHLSTVHEVVEIDGKSHEMSCLSIVSSEFGNLIDPQNRELIDMMVSLWDGENIDKITKTSGSDTVVNPLINLIACTTPAWIGESIPEYMAGGGFMSRCIFVFAHQKARFVAYPGLVIPKNIDETVEKLVADLIEISELKGEFAMTRDAVEWGTDWYNKLQTRREGSIELGTMTRRQTHLHKLAMILSAAKRNNLQIEVQDLIEADEELRALEKGRVEVFKQIGKTSQSSLADKLVATVVAANEISMDELYAIFHSHLPDSADFDTLFLGCTRSGQLRLLNSGKIIAPQSHRPNAEGSGDSQAAA